LKLFILDTNVLLYDASALFKFEDNEVVIPMTVIEDIDRFKSEQSENGVNARQTSRHLDTLREQGVLTKGVPTPSGGVLRVVMNTRAHDVFLPPELNVRNRDGQILSVVLQLAKQQPDRIITLVTKDVNLRLKADALGIAVANYESDPVDIRDLYTGFSSLHVTGEQITAFKKSGTFLPNEQHRLKANEYVNFYEEQSQQLRAAGRFDSQQKKVVRLITVNDDRLWRLNARNQEQHFAIDALLNDSIQLVTLVGKAGTGKTLLAVAASLYKTVEEGVFTRVLVSRPTLPMGKDIGYLPGTIEEKLAPWMYPIADNVEYLMRNESRAGKQVRKFQELVDMGILVIEPLTYIRGRSIHNQFLIIDEAQNLTPHEIKTIITRVGDGTKIVVTGDPYQIDHPYVDSSSNGLTYLVERFKGQPIAAHITLTMGERSVLSELAANLL